MRLAAVTHMTLVDIIENVFTHFRPVKVFSRQFEGRICALVPFVKLLNVVGAKRGWKDDLVPSKYDSVFD